jgi:cell division protein FtsB
MPALRSMRWLGAILIVLAVLLAWLQYRLWVGHGGARDVQDLAEQVQQQRRDNGGLKQRNAEVAAEVEDLKSGEAAVEERARSELGMIKPGETFYRVVEPASTATANDAPMVDPAAEEEPTETTQ